MADAVSAPNAFDPPPTASDRGVMRETVESKAGRGAGEGERIGEGPVPLPIAADPCDRSGNLAPMVL